MSTIGPGDLVQRISGCARFMPIGTVLRVADMCPHGPHDEDPGTMGLFFREYPHKPRGYCRCFAIEDFRKIDKADEGFATWMRSLRPIKTREPEHAASLARQEEESHGE